MQKRYIITLTASNRVGILAAVATALAELGGELQEVKQTLLDRFFTMILLAEFPEHRDTQVIIDHLQGMCARFDIKITLNETSQQAQQPDAGNETRQHRLTMTGRDQPGLLARIAARIARDEIDIAEMHAGRTDEGRSFEIKMQLVAPLAADLAALTADLEEIGREFGVLAWLEDPPQTAAPLDPPVRIQR